MLHAQNEFENSPLYKHIVTVGGSVGPSNYIGDINPRFNFRFLRPSVQVYAKKTLFPYDFSFKLNYNYSLEFIFCFSYLILDSLHLRQLFRRI
jgi:hypothetical protein